MGYKHYVAAFKEDITQDRKTKADIGLDATETHARALISGCIYDELARYGLSNSSDDDGEIRGCDAARKDVTTSLLVKLSAWKVAVIRFRYGGVNVDQSCACVDNAVDTGSSY